MKKLNEVLNGVMNDILTEWTLFSEPNAMDKFREDQKRIGAGYGPADVNVDVSGNHYRYGQPGNNNGVAFGEEPDPSDQGLLDRMSAMWGNLSDGQKLAILGGGIGGTALAAGAGALYLRRKQRDANRALGR